MVMALQVCNRAPPMQPCRGLPCVCFCCECWEPHLWQAEGRQAEGGRGWLGGRLRCAGKRGRLQRHASILGRRLTRGRPGACAFSRAMQPGCGTNMAAQAHSRSTAAASDWSHSTRLDLWQLKLGHLWQLNLRHLRHLDLGRTEREGRQAEGRRLVCPILLSCRRRRLLDRLPLGLCQGRRLGSGRLRLKAGQEQ